MIGTPYLKHVCLVSCATLHAVVRIRKGNEFLLRMQPWHGVYRHCCTLALLKFVVIKKKQPKDQNMNKSIFNKFTGS